MVIGPFHLNDIPVVRIYVALQVVTHHPKPQLQLVRWLIYSSTGGTELALTPSNERILSGCFSICLQLMQLQNIHCLQGYIATAESNWWSWAINLEIRSDNKGDDQESAEHRWWNTGTIKK